MLSLHRRSSIANKATWLPWVFSDASVLMTDELLAAVYVVLPLVVFAVSAHLIILPVVKWLLSGTESDEEISDREWWELDKDSTENFGEDLMVAAAQEKSGSGSPCTFCNLPNGVLRCGQCKAVRYCNQECQKKDWNSPASSHRVKCPVLQVALAHWQQQQKDLQQLQKLEKSLQAEEADRISALRAAAFEEVQTPQTTSSIPDAALHDIEVHDSNESAAVTSAVTIITAAAPPIDNWSSATHVTVTSDASSAVSMYSNGTTDASLGSDGFSATNSNQTQSQPDSNGACNMQPHTVSVSDVPCQPQLVSNNTHKSQPEIEVACKPQPEVMVDDYRLLEVCFQQSCPTSLTQQQQRIKGPPIRHPTGLVNTGNSCFASSTLQCLLATAPLASFLTSGAHALSCCKPTPTTWCLLCELSSLAQKTQLSRVRDGDPVNPGNITRNIRRLCSSMTPGRQEDAHEMFCKVLECMSGISIASFPGGKKRLSPCSQETTLAHHLFGGYTRNSTTCTCCGNVSQVFQSMCDLQLDIDPSMGSVEDCLDGLFAKEWLEGENMYRCDRCSTLVRASKQLGLEVAPNVLAVCLKRFGVMRNGKNKQAVAYPSRLSLNKYFAEDAMDDGLAGYRLYAVLVHIDKQGSTTSGHYVALVCGDDGRWWMCDDDEVDEISTTRAMAMCAYLLFYIREAPRPAPTMKQSPLEAAQAAAEAAVAAAASAPPVEDCSTTSGEHAASSAVVESNGNGHSEAHHPTPVHLHDLGTESSLLSHTHMSGLGCQEQVMASTIGAATALGSNPIQQTVGTKPRNKSAKQPSPQHHVPTYPQPRYLLRCDKPIINSSITSISAPAIFDSSNTITSSPNSPTNPSSTSASICTLPATLYVRLDGIRSVDDVKVCVVGKHLLLVAKVHISVSAAPPSDSPSKNCSNISLGEPSENVGATNSSSNSGFNSNSDSAGVDRCSSNCEFDRVSTLLPVEQQQQLQHLVLHLIFKQPAMLHKCTLRLSCGQLKVTLGAAVSASAKKHKKKREAKRSTKHGAEPTSSNGAGVISANSGIIIDSCVASSSEPSEDGFLDDCLS